MSSSSIKDEMRIIDNKKERLEEYIRSLNSLSVESQHSAERDTSKMDGDKYVEYHDQTQDIVSTCANSVNGQKNSVVAKMTSQNLTYASDLITLQREYNTALHEEQVAAAAEAKKAADKAKEEADKAKNK